MSWRTRGGKDRTARARVGRVDVPAKAALRHAGRSRAILIEDGRAAQRSRRLLGHDHQLQRRLLQRKRPGVVQQLLQQRLREARNIARVGEDARLPRHSAHAPRRGIVYRPAQQMIEVRIRLLRPLVIVLRRCDPIEGEWWFDAWVQRATVESRSRLQIFVPLGGSISRRLGAGASAVGGECCPRHVQRLEDMLLRIHIQRLAA